MHENLDSLKINFDTEGLWVVNITLALIMFGVALGITIEDFKRLLKNPKILITGIVSQFILLPLITFLFIKILNPMPSIALGMMMVAACPGGNISNFLSQMAKGNAALSVSLTAFATIICLVMTPFNFQFWGSIYEPTSKILETVAVSPIEMVKLVSLLLGIPLVLGMLINFWSPNLAKKLAGVLKVVSLLFFIALIFIALYKNREIFLEYVLYVFWIVVMHNILAFSTGFSISKLFRVSPKNTRSITIETGIQNSGLGLLLIFTFFDGLGGMALLAAFWGVWHIVSGLLLASFWGYRPTINKKLA